MCFMSMLSSYEEDPNYQNGESSDQEYKNFNTASDSKTSRSSKTVINLQELRRHNIQNYFEVLGDRGDGPQISQKLLVFVKVTFGDNLHFIMDENGCDIFTKLQIDDDAGCEIWEDAMNKLAKSLYYYCCWILFH